MVINGKMAKMVNIYPVLLTIKSLLVMKLRKRQKQLQQI